jgi:HSP20 family protein
MLLRGTSYWPEWGRTSLSEGLDRMRRQMDLLTEGITRGLWKEPGAGVFPMMNVTEDKDNYYVRAELPGIKAEDLELSVTADTLSISGERKLPTEDENAQYHRRERETGRFSRIISLPSPMDTGKVEAKCNEGILTVTLPKAEAAKPKQITIKAS